MRRASLLLAVLAALPAASVAQTPEGAAPAAEMGLIPPPAIHIPYGGQIVTEFNFSDNDVLGIIKQAIPAIGEALKAGLPARGPEQPPASIAGPFGAAAATVISGIDFKGITEAIEGIKNIRVIVATYPRTMNASKLVKDFESGVAKIGKFSKVASDIAFSPGGFAVYAQSDGGGYVGFAYDSRGGVLYAARVVGFVDIPKLVKALGEIGKALGGTAFRIPVREAPPAVVPSPPK